jgi:hypothetical protein
MIQIYIGKWNCNDVLQFHAAELHKKQNCNDTLQFRSLVPLLWSKKRFLNTLNGRTKREFEHVLGKGATVETQVGFRKKLRFK